MIADNETFNLVTESITVDIKMALSKIPKYYKENIEEIRLRVGCPLSIYAKGQDYFVAGDGNISNNYKDGIIVN